LLVEHIVRLVQHIKPHVPRVQLLLHDHVQHRPWRADDDVGVDGLRFPVKGVFDAEEDRDGSKLAHSPDDFLDLAGELAGGGEADRLRGW
jgi:hypothetical protein